MMSSPLKIVDLQSYRQALRAPRLLAEFSTEPEAGTEASGRWTRLRISLTPHSEYHCEKTRGPSPLERQTATVGDLASARAFFGGGWVVKELFTALDPQQFPRWPRQ